MSRVGARFRSVHNAQCTIIRLVSVEKRQLTFHAGIPVPRNRKN
jgi:hypothetical protein